MTTAAAPPRRSRLKPLSGLEATFLPLLLALARGEARAELEARAEIRHDNVERAKLEREKHKQGMKEAKLYGQLLISTWSRLGGYYAFRWRSAPPSETSAPARRTRKVQRVKFRSIKIKDQFIYYEILTSRKFLWIVVDTLPHKVRLQELVSEETLYELSRSLKRVVSVIDDDPRLGTYIRVHRLEGVGGLPTMVSFKEALECCPSDMSNAVIALGFIEHKKVYYGNFEDQPHWLIGGASGSGKSNAVNLIISTLLWLTDPAEVKLILFDFKAMELVFYEDSPHLMLPVVSDPQQALEILQQLSNEIDRRKALFSRKVRKFSEWNKKFPDEKLPRLIVVIDEFAELMLVYGRKVAQEAEALISHISNIGRAVGVHLIICTQRPGTDVVTSKVKINMALTLAGQVQTSSQSVTILGTGEAAHLPGVKGRMIALTGSKFTQIQTGYISSDEVEQAIAISRGRGEKLIDMDGIEPIINPVGLLSWIVNKNEGKLTVNALSEALAPYAVTIKMLRPFLAETILRGKMTIDGSDYVVKPHRGSYHLVKVDRPPQPITDERYLLPANVPDHERQRTREALEFWRTIRQQQQKEG